MELAAKNLAATKKLDAEKVGNEKAELFQKPRASIMNFVKGGVNLVKGVVADFEDEEEEKQEEAISGLSGALNETKDRLNERGEKLNQLSDKTEELANMSEQFAKMAKELNNKQRGSFFGF